MDAFLLKKIISLLLHPIPAGLLFALAGLVLSRWKSRVGHFIIFTCIGSLLLMSSPATSTYLLETLESRHAVLAEPPENTGIIHALGGGFDYAADRPANSVLLARSLSRVTEAVRLWRLQPDALLMVSGASVLSEVSLARAMANAALAMGVPGERIVTIATARDTLDEVHAARDWLNKLPESRRHLVVVSSAVHLPRADLMLGGFDVAYTMAPTDFIRSREPWYRLSAYHLNASDMVVHEYVGMLWYRLHSGVL